MIIYKVTNSEDGKTYIGQTVRTLETRKAEHLRAAANTSGARYPTPFHKAINELGSGKFVWETMETCSSQEHLNEREKFYIKLLKTLVPNGYNQTTGGSTMDDSMSEEVRRRISDSMVALHKDPAYRARMYPKLKGLIPPNKGVPISDEQKAKISAAVKAVHADLTYINPNVGQRRTEEQKERIRKGREGKLPTGEEWKKAHKDQYTDEVRAKMRAKKLGKKPSNTKKVLCVETGQVFEGLSDASEALGVNRQSIYMQIKGKLKSAGGLHFKYL